MSRRLATLSAMLLSLAMALPAPAQTYDISWFTIDCGGGTSTGGVFELQGTIGQTDTGVLVGGGFELHGGFWGGTVAVVPCPGDTDGDLDVDLSDLAQVLSQFGVSGGGLAGDVDEDGDVDLTDLAIVLGGYGLTCG